MSKYNHRDVPLVPDSGHYAMMRNGVSYIMKSSSAKHSCVLNFRTAVAGFIVIIPGYVATPVYRV
ncbi:MAG TPA: hypothetical protein PK200_17725, partial [Spirochaetota bacterium]|nr:hypothetical protein [Spirochaetota bacterium]